METEIQEKTKVGSSVGVTVKYAVLFGAFVAAALLLYQNTSKDVKTSLSPVIPKKTVGLMGATSAGAGNCENVIQDCQRPCTKAVNDNSDVMRNASSGTYINYTVQLNGSIYYRYTHGSEGLCNYNNDRLCQSYVEASGCKCAADLQYCYN